MSERRMVQCPECKGSGNEYDWSSGLTENCSVCNGSGTIPDRRSPSAADRAVERILAIPEVSEYASYPEKAAYHDGINGTLERVKDIIREEAERG